MLLIGLGAYYLGMGVERGLPGGFIPWWLYSGVGGWALISGVQRFYE